MLAAVVIVAGAASAARRSRRASARAADAQLEAQDKERAHAEAERLEAAATVRQEAAARLEAERRADAVEAPRTPAQTLVMVADDSKVVRVKIIRLLARHGYRVVLAEDGKDAVRLLVVKAPHVLITDVEMPGLDGFGLTRHVRSQPAAAHIPLIMITSAEDRLRQAASDAGVSLLLGKPYPEDALLACVQDAQAGRPAEALVAG